MTRTVHTAPLIITAPGRAITDGAVLVEGGHIVEVGNRRDLVAWGGAEVHHWSGVMIPGLVNAHTHLQYSSIAALGARTYSSFEEWSIAFDEEYAMRRDDPWDESANIGLSIAIASGTTCFGDVVTDQVAMAALEHAGVAGVAYFEVMGVTEDEWVSSVASAVLEVLRTGETRGPTRRGISPHAPYSLDLPVLLRCAEVAREHGCRIHTHLAESAAEDEYYRSGTGPLAELVTDVIGWHWPIIEQGGTRMGSAEVAEAHRLLGPDCHVAHGVYLDARERALLRTSATAVALCVRSNLTIGLDPPPVANYLREGGTVAIGTDSLASNASLDLFDETAVLRQVALDGGYTNTDLDRRLFEAATIGGARALGLEQWVGTLDIGKRADFAVFDVSPEGDVERTLITEGAGRCEATAIQGEVRHRRAPSSRQSEEGASHRLGH